MALGATASGVLRLVIGQGGRLACVGIAVGLIGAIALTRVLERMLFGISAFDTLPFAGAALVLGAVAVLASLIPALRGARRCSHCIAAGMKVQRTKIIVLTSDLRSGR